MNKATRQNPATWGITEQEMNFADEYVMQYFHTNATYSGMAVSAARCAGYIIPVDESKADDLGKSLLEKAEIRSYIDAEIERFRGILSGNQRNNLWKYISDFVAGIAQPGTNDGDYGDIIRH